MSIELVFPLKVFIHRWEPYETHRAPVLTKLLEFKSLADYNSFRNKLYKANNDSSALWYNSRVILIEAVNGQLLEQIGG